MNKKIKILKSFKCRELKNGNFTNYPKCYKLKKNCLTDKCKYKIDDK